jgi:5-methylcytosine-specific restriction endonuclease McrA
MRGKSEGQYITVGEFTPEDVLPYIGNGTRDYVGTDDKTYHVGMGSQRYMVFAKNRSCVCCGLTGTIMLLQMDKAQVQAIEGSKAHFNLYAKIEDKLILMTKDHIVAKSNGNNNSLKNHQTMCSHCNRVKANRDISLEELQKQMNGWVNVVKSGNSDFMKPLFRVHYLTKEPQGNYVIIRRCPEKEMYHMIMKEIGECFAEQRPWEVYCFETLVVQTFRTAIAEGIITPDNIRFYYDDKLLGVDENGNINDLEKPGFPRGFCDLSLNLSRRILDAIAKKE